MPRSWAGGDKLRQAPVPRGVWTLLAGPDQADAEDLGRPFVGNSRTLVEPYKRTDSFDWDDER